jgi:hypothetical protein
MNWLVALYLALLFFILSPNILVRLPPNGNKLTVTATHALIFGVIVYLTCNMIWKLSISMGIYEGMTTAAVQKPKKK